MIEQVIYAELKNNSPGSSEYLIFRTLDEFRRAILSTMDVGLGENTEGEDIVREEKRRVAAVLDSLEDDVDLSQLVFLLNQKKEELEHHVLYDGVRECWINQFYLIDVVDQVSSGDSLPLVVRGGDGRYQIYPGQGKVDLTSDGCSNSALYFKLQLGELVYGDDYWCGCFDCR